MWELRVNSCRWEQRSPRTSWARSSFGTIHDESSLRRLRVTSSWSRGKRQGSKWSHFAPPHWLNLGSPFLLDSGPRLSWPLANPGNAQAKKNVRIITSISRCLKTIAAWSWRRWQRELLTWIVLNDDRAQEVQRLRCSHLQLFNWSSHICAGKKKINSKNFVSL